MSIKDVKDYIVSTVEGATLGVVMDLSITRDDLVQKTKSATTQSVKMVDSLRAKTAEKVYNALGKESKRQEQERLRQNQQIQLRKEAQELWTKTPDCDKKYNIFKLRYYETQREDGLPKIHFAYEKFGEIRDCTTNEIVDPSLILGECFDNYDLYSGKAFCMKMQYAHYQGKCVGITYLEPRNDLYSLDEYSVGRIGVTLSTDNIKSYDPRILRTFASGQQVLTDDGTWLNDSSPLVCCETPNDSNVYEVDYKNFESKSPFDDLNGILGLCLSLDNLKQSEYAINEFVKKGCKLSQTYYEKLKEKENKKNQELVEREKRARESADAQLRIF